MFFGKKKLPAFRSRLVAVNDKDEFYDERIHPIGDGDCSVGASYTAVDNGILSNVVYRQSEATKVYGSYVVTKEAIEEVGIETRINFNNKYRPVLDLTYRPATDSVTTRLQWDNEKTRVRGWLALENVRADKFAKHNETLEVRHAFTDDTRLSVGYDVKGNQVNAHVDHRVSDDNMVRLKAESITATDRSVTAEVRRLMGPNNILIAGADFGAKNINIGWINDVDDGRWEVHFDVPFNTNPKNGELAISRRYDF